MTVKSSTDTSAGPGNSDRDNRLAEDGTFRHTIRVYYEDTDAAGVVYYANYLRFMERGRTEWLRALGHPVEQMAAEQGRAFVVLKAYVDYLAPARLGDELVVSVALDRDPDGEGEPNVAVKGAVISMRQTINLREDIIVTARVELACVRTDTLRPTRLPRNLLGTLNAQLQLNELN